METKATGAGRWWVAVRDRPVGAFRSLEISLPEKLMLRYQGLPASCWPCSVGPPLLPRVPLARCLLVGAGTVGLLSCVGACPDVWFSTLVKI